VNGYLIAVDSAGGRLRGLGVALPPVSQLAIRAAANPAVEPTGADAATDRARGVEPASAHTVAVRRSDLATIAWFGNAMVGLPAPPDADARTREQAIGVLAQVIGRDGQELSATETSARNLASADHLAAVHAMRQGQVQQGPRAAPPRSHQSEAKAGTARRPPPSGYLLAATPPAPMPAAAQHQMMTAGEFDDAFALRVVDDIVLPLLAGSLATSV